MTLEGKTICDHNKPFSHDWVTDEYTDHKFDFEWLGNYLFSIICGIPFCPTFFWRKRDEKWKASMIVWAKNFFEPKKRLRDRNSTFPFIGIARILCLFSTGYIGVGDTCRWKNFDFLWKALGLNFLFPAFVLNKLCECINFSLFVAFTVPFIEQTEKFPFCRKIQKFWPINFHEVLVGNGDSLRYLRMTLRLKRTMIRDSCLCWLLSFYFIFVAAKLVLVTSSWWDSLFLFLQHIFISRKNSN